MGRRAFAIIVRARNSVAIDAKQEGSAWTDPFGEFVLACRV